jgi:hypothetical protein
MAEQLALHLSIDQAGAYLVVVHGLGHQRIALRPVIAALGDEPDAHGIAAGHQPEAVVLDLVNPIGAGRGLVGRRWEAGFDAARPVSGQALTHTLNQHAANLGGGGGESSRTARTQRRPWIRFRGWGATPLRRQLTERPRGIEGCRGALAPHPRRVRQPAAPHRLVFAPTLRSIKLVLK